MAHNQRRLGFEARRPSSDKTEAAFRRLDHFFGSPSAQKKGFPSEEAAAHSAATLLAAQMRMPYGTAIKVVHEWYRRESGGVHEARETRTVADFNTLDDLIAHARDELGASHVVVAGPESKIFFPRGGAHPYEAASVRRKGGYWHADGPGAREGVKSLPAAAQPIGGGRVGRKAAETPVAGKKLTLGKPEKYRTGFGGNSHTVERTPVFDSSGREIGAIQRRKWKNRSDVSTTHHATKSGVQGYALDWLERQEAAHAGGYQPNFKGPGSDYTSEAPAPREVRTRSAHHHPDRPRSRR